MIRFMNPNSDEAQTDFQAYIRIQKKTHGHSADPDFCNYLDLPDERTREIQFSRQGHGCTSFSRL